MSLKPAHVLGGAGLLVAGLVAYLATRSAGPVAMSQYTELRTGPLQEHLVTEAELGAVPAAPRHHYPARVAPQLTRCIHHGFVPQYLPLDPQIRAALAANAGAW